MVEKRGWVRETLRLFQHTELEHTPKPLPTGYNGIPFIVGERGDAERVCDIGVCCNCLGETELCHYKFQAVFFSDSYTTCRNKKTFAVIELFLLHPVDG